MIPHKSNLSQIKTSILLVLLISASFLLIFSNSFAYGKNTKDVFYDVPNEVRDFYQKALTVNDETTADQVLSRILSDDFLSHDSMESVPKQALMKKIPYFWKLIPDLKWNVQEVLRDGNKYIVRSRATGTPIEGNFFNQPTDGTKSFSIQTIDIHTYENGKIVKSYHIEDWFSALNQLAK